MLYYNCSKGVAIYRGTMEGSQHLPCEYQIMCVGGVYELVWPSDKPLFREDNKWQEELVDFCVSRFIAGRARGCHLLRFSKRKEKRVKKPQIIQKDFIRGKNNEAVGVRPQQDNEIAPSDKIKKSS